MPLTVGTAGHIDHGKTWLVRALTGKDTDRLPEEQARGISIDLGYAPLDLPDGRRLSLIDVPGHERFVRTMVAGATGIDLFLLVVDAGEGARPQTHEHLAILRLLGVERGVVAVTKADAVDAETLELAVAEGQELVPGAEVVPVSAKTGEGLDELRAALGRVAAGIEHERPGGGTRLYIDRTFTLTGVGTVVTGTLWSGAIGPGDSLEVQPSGLRARARTVHVHDVEVPRAEAGQRVAVNLPGIERSRLRRGDVLVQPGFYPVTWRLDVALEELEQVPPAVTVHIGTSDVPARVVRDGRYAQLRLRESVLAARGDRVVLRTETTVGGGVVLDPFPPRGLDAERLALLEKDDPEAIVRALDRLRVVLLQQREPLGVEAARRERVEDHPTADGCLGPQHHPVAARCEHRLAQAQLCITPVAHDPGRHIARPDVHRDRGRDRLQLLECDIQPPGDGVKAGLDEDVASPQAAALDPGKVDRDALAGLGAEDVDVVHLDAARVGSQARRLDAKLVARAD